MNTYVVTTRYRASGPRFSAQDRREQILHTATQLFARQGFQGTTTREIAQSAQINEAIIFRHFPSKEDLYWAVIEHQCQQPRSRNLVAEYLVQDLPLEDVFVGIARTYLQLRQHDSTLVRLLLFSALEHHELSQRFFRTHMADSFDGLAQFIRQQIKAGKFRDVDPVMAARGFWGMLVYHFLVQELFGAKQFQEIDINEASRMLVDVWLRGMLPVPEKKKSRAARTGRESVTPPATPITANAVSVDGSNGGPTANGMENHSK